MVTYRHSQAELHVRFMVPHPLLFVFVFIFLLADQAAAEDLVYTLGTDTSLVSAVSVEPRAVDKDPLLARLFNNSFYGSSTYRLVTRWNNLKITEESEQSLAYEVLDLATGIDAAIQSVSGDVVANLDEWTNKSVGADIIGGNNDVYYKTVPDLLALITSNQKGTYNAIYSPSTAHTIGGSSFYPTSLVQYLSVMTSNQKAIHDFLSKGFASEYSFYSSFMSSGNISADPVSYGSSLSLGSGLAAITTNQVYSDVLMRKLLSTDGLNYSMLLPDGTIGKTGQYDGSPSIVARGFAGLGHLISNGENTFESYMYLPSDPLFDPERHRFFSLFDFLGYWGTEVQRSLVKLQFVLANDEDIKMQQQEAPNKDAVQDNFFGDGQAAIKPSDISDAASLGSDAKQSFSGAGSAGDAFTTLNDGNNYSFFSQEVADTLDTVGQSQSRSTDDYMSAFVVDSDGFYSLADSSYWDLSKYLEGASK